ncbi:hypothetical protein C1S80_06580 [Mycolicibacterium aubagnense]|nr:hypothetical protein C1S80_06580 [Mycolicibacterium aubagnense]
MVTVSVLVSVSGSQIVCPCSVVDGPSAGVKVVVQFEVWAYCSSTVWLLESIVTVVSFDSICLVLSVVVVVTPRPDVSCTMSVSVTVEPFLYWIRVLVCTPPSGR